MINSTGEFDKALLSHARTVLAESRHMTQGQCAMLVAMIYPEPEKGRGKKDAGKKAAEAADFSERRLRQARFVLRYSVDDDLANDVLLKEMDARGKNRGTSVSSRIEAGREAGMSPDQVQQAVNVANVAEDNATERCGALLKEIQNAKKQKVAPTI